MKPTGKLPAAHDWNEARKQLIRAAEAAEKALHVPPDRERAVLDERARSLAQAPTRPETAAVTLAVVAFRIGAEAYAFETRYVREVARATDITLVPGAPPLLVGVMNLRGDVLPVFDLRGAFQLGAADAGDRPWIVVLGREGAELGVLADAVEQVAVLDAGVLLPPPETVGVAARRWMRGTTQEALVVLDGGDLLSDPELFAVRNERSP